MSPTIVAKSDQVNADDLIGGPMTITIQKVDKKLDDPSGQTAWIHYGDPKKTYKPGLSMRRVLIAVYGNDLRGWLNKRITLFRDPEVPFGSAKVGGVRISHMSGIDEPRTIMIATKKGTRKPYTVLPLIDEPKPQPQQKNDDRAAQWAREFIVKVKACDTAEALATLIQANRSALEKLESEHKPLADDVYSVTNAKRKNLEAS